MGIEFTLLKCVPDSIKTHPRLKLSTHPIKIEPCWIDDSHFHSREDCAFFLVLSALTWPVESKGTHLEVLEWFDTCWFFSGLKTNILAMLLLV